MTDGVKRYFLLIPGIPAAAVNAVFPVALFASENAHNVPGPEGLIKPAVNFVIFVALIYIFGRKPFASALRKRASAFEEKILSSAGVLDKARSELALANQKIKNADSDIEDIKSRIRREGEKEAEAILLEAAARAKRLVERAKESGTAERQAAERELRTELAKLVINAAAGKIREQVSPEKDRELRQEALGGLSLLSVN